VHHWSGLTVRRRHSTFLAVAERDEFERRVLPFLRLHWPTIQQAPRLGGWDAKGVDLIVWADDGAFPIVAQAKGFLVQTIGPDQIRQIEASIDAFEASDVAADCYLLLHNRDNRSEELRRRVAAKLERLVLTGRVNRCEFWDRLTTLDRAYERMVELLSLRLRQQAVELEARFEQVVRFGEIHVPAVPYRESRVEFRRGEPARLEQVSDLSVGPLHERLLEPTEARWTMVAGRFGTGKTTAVLHSALAASRVTLFVPCTTLPGPGAPVSTSELIEGAMKGLEILGDFGAGDRPILEEVAGGVASYLLRHPDTPYALVLDGLDEHRAYASLPGLQRLSNQLADLRCPIVLTTRTEHLHSLFGDFSVAFSEFSSKQGPNRAARLYELESWSRVEISTLLKGILESASLGESERGRLSSLQEAFETGTIHAYYGRMPEHPLFLRFIIDDVLDTGLRQSNRASLLDRWVRRKIRRDRKAWAPDGVMRRLLVDNEGMDTEAVVEGLMRIMEATAVLMVQRDERGISLAETVDEQRVAEEVHKRFPAADASVLGVLLNSVLISHGPRKGSMLRVGFLYRILHEYFVAAALVREGLSADGFPGEIPSLCQDIGP
jgi:hypothetical protein